MWALAARKLHRTPEECAARWAVIKGEPGNDGLMGALEGAVEREAVHLGQMQAKREALALAQTQAQAQGQGQGMGQGQRQGQALVQAQ
eukprot:CAMPEP_0173353476 /NCGR_PEP_ID=MMETSP1144-20121109/16636_1 /TAXON_ID=483371 /ORGANISM="non described non described, Strain CCMP2298" /LENGTH=87 /DNA_ID=CAMNT_0014301889 /DNA_START=150 /DNA_END=410 /DNA_ORIENTATION=+